VLAGHSIVTDLTIAGLEVAVTGSPNQGITIPGLLSLVINEQLPTVNGTSGELVVNALHLKLLSGEDIVVSSARADILCRCAD
jgi:hypothetical protein